MEFDDSLTSWSKFENLTYGFTLRLSVPLQNSAARANLTKSEIAKRNAILNARETETGIILEVANAVRQIKSTRRAVNAAVVSAAVSICFLDFLMTYLTA